MAFYARIMDDGQIQGPWKITRGVGKRLDVSCGPGSVDFWEPLNGLTPMDRIKDRSGWFTETNPDPLRKLTLEPGQYYRRIARPDIHNPGQFPSIPQAFGKDAAYIDQSWRQLENLLRLLDQICMTLEPVKKNMGAYGHDIRNLILLACTDVEMHWTGVLKVNGYFNDRKKFWNTEDYVKLLPVMKLDQISVRYLDYPWLGDFRPFAEWNPEKASKSLVWYSAYNAIKHDLEGKFPQASLGNAFNAVAGVMAMLAAQFGRSFGQNGGILSVSVVDAPSWEISDCYCDPYGERPDWKAVKMDFDRVLK